MGVAPGAGAVVRRPPFGSNPTVGERGTDTQRRILEAALDVFGEVGFNEARVELITERAGCSRPAFYQYFSSKDDVFWELASGLGRAMVEVAERLEPVTAGAAGIAALSRWIDDFMALHDDFAPVFRAFQAASRDHQTLAHSSSGVSDRTAEALLRAFGVRRSRRSAAVAGSLVAVLIRCSFYSQTSPGIPREPLVAALSRTIHRLFHGPLDGVNVVSFRPRRVPDLAAIPPGPDDDGTRRPRGERTRQRLLDAGASVLPARGYHDARVDDIVEAAGVSHGTFYRYFANKDDFFRVLAESATAGLIHLLDELVVTATAAGGGLAEVDVLRAWLDAWFDAYRSNGGVISTWQEMRTDGEMTDFSQAVATSVLGRLQLVLGTRSFGDQNADAVPLLALLERAPYSVLTLQFVTQADAIEAMVTILRRGFFALADD